MAALLDTARRGVLPPLCRGLGTWAPASPWPTAVCVFLMAGSLCRVHPVKPFICRQWPFLPALLVDPDELEHAKTACPGLNPACTHEDFVEAALNQARRENSGDRQSQDALEPKALYA